MVAHARTGATGLNMFWPFSDSLSILLLSQNRKCCRQAYQHKNSATTCFIVCKQHSLFDLCVSVWKHVSDAVCVAAVLTTLL